MSKPFFMQQYQEFPDIAAKFLKNLHRKIVFLD